MSRMGLPLQLSPLLIVLSPDSAPEGQRLTFTLGSNIHFDVRLTLRSSEPAHLVVWPVIRP